MGTEFLIGRHAYQNILHTVLDREIHANPVLTLDNVQRCTHLCQMSNILYLHFCFFAKKKQ